MPHLLYQAGKASLVLRYPLFCSVFVKLDQNNISNAYVSGMAEELGFGAGNELSWMNTYFSIGEYSRNPRLSNGSLIAFRHHHWRHIFELDSDYCPSSILAHWLPLYMVTVRPVPLQM